MKKSFSKQACGFALAALMTGMVSVAGQQVWADGTDGEMTVTIRIEGISENLYYDTVTVPYDDGSLTVAEALIYADEQSDDITVTGAADGYITQVNDDAAGTFGGWDGWLYTVNGESPSVSCNEYELKADDVIVLYYGDPYGVGMQYPDANIDEIADGIVKFTSKDTTYDENYNPIVSVNPVAGMTVKLGTSSYVTDEEGKIQISDADLAALPLEISLEKIAENGCPLVLRLAPGTRLYAATNAGIDIPANMMVWAIVTVLAGAYSVYAFVLRKKA